jgi:predicted ester cyclase
MTPQEKNKLLVKTFIEEAQSKCDLELVDKYLHPDFLDKSGASNPNPDPTKSGSLAIHKALFDAFPDFKVEIHQMIAEGNKVVTHKTFYGTHTNDFLIYPATQKQMEFNVIDILGIEDGLIKDHYVVTNMVERLETAKDA